MKRQLMVAGVALALFAAPLLLRAEHTRVWRQTGYAEFEKGNAKGVSLRSDGKLMPAPRFAAFADPNMAYLWALRLDSRGRLYAAGGSDAKVLRFDDAGKAETIFESAELAAQAIVFDAHDNLFVGTSPDGKVYKVTREGQKSAFFDPKCKYIWALAADPDGDLFVATGDDGKVFVVGPDGKGELFYQSDERHARSLAFDSHGNLLIGTDPNGLIVRVPITRKDRQPLPEAGAVFVIYETNRKEVTSLIAARDGNLYAATVGDKARPAGTPPPLLIPSLVGPPQPSPAAVAAQGGVTITQTQAPAPQPSAALPFFPSVAGGGEVVRISSDGSPETLWTSREDLVFALGQSSGGKILLGTGNKGAVVELEEGNVSADIAKTAAAQVTSIVSGSGGKMFVATANPGKIFTLGPGYESQGTFESDTFDARIFSHWGRLTWSGENGATSGKVAFYVRSGNTSSAEKNWSPWAGPYKTPGAETVSCPPARFAQWKAVFLESNGGAAPSISAVSLAYQPKNVAPVIDDIVIQEPGIRVQGFVLAPAAPAAAPAPLRLPARAGSAFPAPTVTTDTSVRPPRVDAPPQGFEDKGFQSVLWSAHDDNDDELVFTIYYRGEGETNWRLLKDKLTQKFYSWSTATTPDGAYYLKIVASDSASNPPDQALSSERETDRFEVANTPPRIENLRAVQASPSVRVTFEGISAGAPITRAQYSLDGGDWLVVFPTGVLSDAPRESYQIELRDLAAGEHTIAVEVSDSYNNSATAKTTFVFAAHASH